jgi:hypothetical protein
VDLVHVPVDLFHGFSYRKLILQILKITGAQDFYI